jgi:hypothetical protein
MTLRVVSREVVDDGVLDLALYSSASTRRFQPTHVPRSLCTVGRHQNVLVGQFVDCALAMAQYTDNVDQHLRWTP